MFRLHANLGKALKTARNLAHLLGEPLWIVEVKAHKYLVSDHAGRYFVGPKEKIRP